LAGAEFKLSDDATLNLGLRAENPHS
jgi:hypothetical protein